MGLDQLSVTVSGGRVQIAIHARPRAKKSRLAAIRAGALEVQLAAPPVEGAANEELRQYLAQVFGVPKRDIALVHGDTSRHKRIAITGLSPDEVVARVKAHLPQDEKTLP